MPFVGAGGASASMTRFNFPAASVAFLSFLKQKGQNGHWSLINPGDEVEGEGKKWRRWLMNKQDSMNSAKQSTLLIRSATNLNLVQTVVSLELWNGRNLSTATFLHDRLLRVCLVNFQCPFGAKNWKRRLKQQEKWILPYNSGSSPCPPPGFVKL